MVNTSLRPRRVIGAGLLAALLLAAGCDSPASAPRPDAAATHNVAKPRGDRILAIDVNQASDGDYDTAFRLAQQAGAQVVSLSIAWDSFEVAPGKYSPEPDYLSIANAYYPPYDTPLALTLAPIDTHQLRIPRDLEALRFDDPQMIARFNRALAEALARLPDTEVSVLAIGNEIDVYLQGDPARCAAYASFFAATADYARTLRPGLQVGTKATTNGLLGDNRECLEAINRHSDLILATYYPLDADFRVRPPSSPAVDFHLLAELSAPKPLYLLEVGYPSSERLGSSEALQAEFISQVFQAWDAQAEAIPYVSFTWLNDISREDLNGYLEYYGLDAEGFAAFLASLGLRTHDGREKPAFRVLQQEATARGW